MSKIPTLEEFVQVVERLSLRKRRKAPRLGQNARYCGCPQGRKHTFSDSFIVALAVYQKLASFRHAQKTLAVMISLGVKVPAPSTFSERKAALLAQVVLAVKQLCSEIEATHQHLDSKKLEVVDFARAGRTRLAGSHGFDHIHNRIFYGFRLHALVNDAGQLCRLVLRAANEHDVKVAPRLLSGLSYTIVTGDKGYISKGLKADLAKSAVDLVTPRKSNQLPPPEREKVLYKGHRMIETTFSSLDRLDLSDRPYRSNIGLVLHVYTTILAYQPFYAYAFRFRITLFRIGVT